MTKAQKTVRVLIFDSYLATIKNSIGAKVFQTLWAEVDGSKNDILRGGERSCAAFVSGILLWFGLIKGKHATIAGTLRDMNATGWQKINEPRIGCVVHWEKALINGEENEHIGFYVEKDAAVSNDYRARTPVAHHWTYGEVHEKPIRKIVGMYWHPALEN